MTEPAPWLKSLWHRVLLALSAGPGGRGPQVEGVLEYRAWWGKGVTPGAVLGLPPVMALLVPVATAMAPWPGSHTLVGQSTLPAFGPHQGVSDLPPTSPPVLSLW